jgi:hypothetical protein
MRECESCIAALFIPRRGAERARLPLIRRWMLEVHQTHPLAL